jgi:hypothetical protein
VNEKVQFYWPNINFTTEKISANQCSDPNNGVSLVFL